MFFSKTNPKIRLNNLSHKKIQSLVNEIKKVIKKAINEEAHQLKLQQYRGRKR